MAIRAPLYGHEAKYPESGPGSLHATSGDGPYRGRVDGHGPLDVGIADAGFARVLDASIGGSRSRHCHQQHDAQCGQTDPVDLGEWTRAHPQYQRANVIT